MSIAPWFVHSVSVLRRVGSCGALPCLGATRRASAHALRARRRGAGRSHGPYPPPTDPRSPHRTTPLSHKRSLHPCTPPHGTQWSHADTTHAPRHDDAREVHAGRSWGGRTIRDDCPRSQGHRLGVGFASLRSTFNTLFITPLKHTKSTRSRAAAPASGARRALRAALGDAAAPFRWRTGSMDGGRSRRSLVGTSRLVTPCHEWRRSSRLHAQPGQLVRAFGRGPPPHAGTKHRPVRPPRTARPTRRAPCRSQAMRWGWPCAAAHSRARYQLRAGRVARVEHAETARVRP